MILLVGQSASGKTEIAKSLSKNYHIKKAITNTTRSMRNGEVNGVDYYFLTKEEFLKLKEDNKLVESTLYNGNYYGCSKSEVGKDKCIVLEPDGISSFLKLNDGSMVVFLLKASKKTREERMLSRGDKLEDIKKRLDNDEERFKESNVKYDYAINTDNRSIDELTREIYNLYINSIK